MRRAVHDISQAAAWLQMPLWRLAAAAAAGAAGVASAVALVGVAAWIIATAAGMPGVAALGLSVVAVRALGISRGALRYTERLLSHDVALRGLTQLRGALYAHCATADTAVTASWSRGRVIHHLIRDADVLCGTVVRGVLPCVVVGAIAVLATTALWWIVGVAAVWFVAGVGVAIVGATWVMATGTAAALRREQDAAADTADVVDTVLTHRAEWEVAGRFDEAAQRLAVAHQHVAAAARPHAWAAGGASAFIWVGLVIAVGGVLATAHTSPAVLADPVWYCVAGLLPLATFDAVSVLPPAIRELIVGQDAARRLAPIMALPAVGPETIPGSARFGALTGGEAAPAIAALGTDALVVGWAGNPVCQVPEVRLHPGDCLALIGPSGSGKTATLLTFAGLLPPVSGTVSLECVSPPSGGSGYFTPAVCPSDLPPQQARDVVAIGTEDAYIFGTSVRENLTLTSGYACDDWLLEVVRLVGLESWLADTPAGLDTVLSADQQGLSGGQRRRLILARTLAAKTPVVLLDEPTEHLDAAGATELAETLRDWATRHQVMVVVATHAASVFTQAQWPVQTVSKDLPDIR